VTSQCQDDVFSSEMSCFLEFSVFEALFVEYLWLLALILKENALGSCYVSAIFRHEQAGRVERDLPTNAVIVRHFRFLTQQYIHINSVRHTFPMLSRCEWPSIFVENSR
jgi:hypothetical protein